MQLTKREKIVVFGGTGGLLLLMMLQFVVRPTMEQISTLRRVVTDKREVLGQMQAKGLEYRRLEAEVGRIRSTIEQQQESRRILSTIEGVRKECDLPENVLSLKPTTMPINTEYQQTVVEVRLEGVSLNQLIAFLTQLDALNLAGGIQNLDIRTAGRSAGSLRAVVQLATVVPIEGV